MNYKVEINPFIENEEVPQLRQKVGWGPRFYEYPELFKRCNFYGAVRNENGNLIAFAYICGMGLEHGYLEDVLVDPDYQRRGIGTALVKALLEQAKKEGIQIVSVNFDKENEEFYRNCGFDISCSGTVIY